VGRFYLDDRDPLLVLKDSLASHDFYVAEVYFIEDCFKFDDRVKINYLNFQAQNYMVSVSELRKSRLNKDIFLIKNSRKFATCRCGKSHWFFTILDRNSFPEMNRKVRSSK
jgi:hypothetical protein